jgi:hypothetical protein
MSFWDGTRWVDERDAGRLTGSSRQHTRRTDWLATAIMILGLVALMLPLAGTSAASRRHDPTLAVSCGASACTVGGSLTISGAGYTPSAGGQQVFLWVGYPGDYCGSAGCHGIYYNPWVASDGTFRVTMDNVLQQAGTGYVNASQYQVKSDKWVEVAGDTYTVK